MLCSYSSTYILGEIHFHLHTTTSLHITSSSPFLFFFFFFFFFFFPWTIGRSPFCRLKNVAVGRKSYRAVERSFAGCIIIRQDTTPHFKKQKKKKKIGLGDEHCRWFLPLILCLYTTAYYAYARSPKTQKASSKQNTGMQVQQHIGSTTTHTPAWKKLGLKLKYARDEKRIKQPTPQNGSRESSGQRAEVVADQSDLNGQYGTAKQKREREYYDVQDGGPKKKKKKKQGDTKAAGRIGENHIDYDDGEAKAETNKKMGETASSSLPAMEYGDKRLESKKEDDDVNRDEEDGKKSKRAKREERKKGRQKASESVQSGATTTAHESPMLSYLSRYYKNRDRWKFQKSREVHLFKHVMSLDQVPSLYNAALLAYLKGLRGEGSKCRLSQTAEQAIKADLEEEVSGKAADDDNDDDDDEATSRRGDQDGRSTTNNTTASSSSYATAVEHLRKQLYDDDIKGDFRWSDESQLLGDIYEDLRKRLARRYRAELVWFAVNDGKTFGVAKSQQEEAKMKPEAGSQKSSGADKKKKKKRKNRTAIVEISSSSESESSSDDESTSSSGGSDEADSST